MPLPLTEMAGDVRTDQLSGSFAQRPSGRSLGEAAGSGTLRGAGEEGQEEGHEDAKECPTLGGVGFIIRRLEGALLP